MASKEQLAIDIVNDDDEKRSGILFYTAFTPSDRTRRAIIALVGCWLGAVISIPIILAHYILIPAFLIAGPILARARLKQQDAKEKVEGECPHHNGQFSLKLEATDTLPKWIYCPECDKGLQIFARETNKTNALEDAAKMDNETTPEITKDSEDSKGQISDKPSESRDNNAA